MFMDQSSGCGVGRSGWILYPLFKKGCPDFLILRVGERTVKVSDGTKVLVLAAERLEASLTEVR